MGQAITVIKLDTHGRELWRYPGVVLERRSNCVIIQAHFDRDERLFYGMPLRPGDRFVETYYTDRWYNIYEIHACEDDHLRGWYCNIGKPAVIQGETIAYIDLALDLLIFPDGRQLVLDQDEFASLDIPPWERAQALAALAELQTCFSKRQGSA